MVLATLLVPFEECRAQMRHLRSRALFAALDSTALEDSSAIQPMKPHQSLDSVMMDMVAFLDGTVGPAQGLKDTPIRRWDGFGTQAHPLLGILVDFREVAMLLDEVREYKQAVHVPEGEIDHRLEYVIRFLVAHEYGHLMQYRYFGPDSVANLNATRVIECGADLLGGFNLRAFLGSRYAEGSFPEAAEQAAIDFGYVVGGTDWLDGTTHPLPEDRRRCIKRGIEAERAVANSQGDSAAAIYQASREWLRDSEPELAGGTSNLMRWSQGRARAIVAEWEVIDSNAVLAVVRDSSPVRLVRKLADATARGQEALRQFRGDSAPYPRGTYLLREALPVPWQCLIAQARQAETALCFHDGRKEQFAQFTFERLATSVRGALKGTPWRPIKGRPDSIFAQPSGREVLAKAQYGLPGARPEDPNAARIEILFLVYPVSMTAQMESTYSVLIMFRTRR